MALKDCVGRSNSRDIIRHMVGERIKGAYFDATGALVIVTDDGVGLRVCSLGGGSPAYVVESTDSVAADVRSLRERIERDVAMAGDLMALEP